METAQQCALITIPFSHYCEKARWGMDWAGIVYREEAYIPGFHLLGTKVRARGKSVPVLVSDRDVLTDSAAILRFADRNRRSEQQSLFGTTTEQSTQISELEAMLDEKLGPATRLLAYHNLFQRPSSLMRLVNPSFSLMGRVGFAMSLPVLKKLITKGYRITPERAAAARDKIEECFSATDRLLASQPYLGGSDFSAADLTLAALAAPVLLWPGTGYSRRKAGVAIDPVDLIPDALAELVRNWRLTATGEHCRKMYLSHRQIR